MKNHPTSTVALSELPVIDFGSWWPETHPKHQRRFGESSEIENQLMLPPKSHSQPRGPNYNTSLVAWPTPYAINVSEPPRALQICGSSSD